MPLAGEKTGPAPEPRELLARWSPILLPSAARSLARSLAIAQGPAELASFRGRHGLGG